MSASRMFTEKKKRRPVFDVAGVLAAVVLAPTARAQIDPVRRDLIQAGYSQPLGGSPPVAAYGYYYLNRPEFLRPNLALRLVAAPLYVDGELGIRGIFGPDTDLALGLSGGGFGYSYEEIRRGEWLRDQSYTGHGGGASLSLVHRVNPGARIPLSGMLRGEFSYASFVRRSDNPADFVLPPNQPVATLRAGVRFGGEERRLDPAFAMELSAWYEGQFRFEPGDYGFHGDRRVEPEVHRFWGRGLLVYTMPDSRQRLAVGVLAGGSVHPDRFSAYRVGGVFTLASEFPLVLPGYFEGELSARSLVLMGASYSVPLEPARRWFLTVGGSTGKVAYTPGLEQPGAWNSGVGAGVTYLSLSKSWKLSLYYGYGFNAVRGDHLGGNSLTLQIQYDLERMGGARREPNPSSYFERMVRTLRRLSLKG
ncbi:MAG: hypothetical protein H6Q78_1368 [Candidatus Krumholzibacteriota bacterium]|nr:hypothetical protein [Candidatus Krumholzibacteriota bacterium]